VEANCASLMKEPFETFLLYYFSAIAQVVAAVIALGGVFLVFYMQSLNKSILNYSKNLSDNINSFISMCPLSKKFDFKELSTICGRLNNAINSEDINYIYSNFNHLQNTLNEFQKKNSSISEELFYIEISMASLELYIDFRKHSFYYFKRSFIYGSIVILLSLSFIIFSYRYRRLDRCCYIILI
jgi:hypothetical protein